MGNLCSFLQKVTLLQFGSQDFSFSLLTETDLSPSRLVLPELSNVAVCLLTLPHTTHLQRHQLDCHHCLHHCVVRCDDTWCQRLRASNSSAILWPMWHALKALSWHQRVRCWCYCHHGVLQILQNTRKVLPKVIHQLWPRVGVESSKHAHLLWHQLRDWLEVHSRSLSVPLQAGTDHQQTRWHWSRLS